MPKLWAGVEEKVCTNAIKFDKNAQNQYEPHTYMHSGRTL